MDRADRSLHELVTYRLRRTTVDVMIEFNALFAEFGLRRTTFSALTLIVDNPGMRQVQLADSLTIERPNIVQIVDELERAGLVERQTAENDRRAYALRPTAAGIELKERALARAHQRDAEILDGLTPEQIDALLQALGIIQKNARKSRAKVHEISRA